MKEKIIATFLTAIMALTPIVVALDLGDYPTFLFVDHNLDAYVVVGADADPSDVAGAIDLAIRLAGESYEEVTTGAAVAVVTITGEAFRIDASGDEFNYDQDIYDIDKKMTGTDLPILEDQTFDDNKGTNKGDYEYSQKLEFTNTTGLVKFVRKETGDKEADTYLYFDDASSKYMYTYTLDFTTENPTADATDLEQNDITILGTEYTIVDATVTGAILSKLVLMGGTSKVTGDHGVAVDVVVGDTTYTVTPKVYSSSSTVIFDVTYDGTTETTDALAAGDTYELGDGSLVGLTSMATSAKEGVADTATFFVGAQKLTLENGQKVKVGDTKVDGTNVYFSNTTSGWDTVNVTYVPSDDLYIAAGEEYVDPVFESFKFMFEGMDKTTEHIDIDPDGSDKIEIKTTNKDGNVLEFDAFYYLTDTFYLGEDQDNQLIVDEGDILTGTNVGGTDITALEGTRFLYDFDSIAHLVEILDIDTTNSQCDFRVISLGDKDYEDQSCTTDGTAITTFTFMDSDFQLNITSTGAATSSITFTDITDKAGGISMITTEHGALINFTEGGSWINITEVDTSISTGVTLKLSGVVNLTWDSTNERININQPTGVGTFLKKEDGDLYNKEVATTYGTIWAYNSEAQGYVDIDYPDEEADAKVYVAQIGAVSTTTEAAEGETVKKVVPVTTAVAKLDTEIDDPATVGKDLVLVGGPAINKHTAAAMGLDYPTYGASGLLPIEEGEGYIALYEDVFTTGQEVVVVFGWEADDTRVACSALQQYESLASDLAGHTAVKVTGTITTPVITAV